MNTKQFLVLRNQDKATMKHPFLSLFFTLLCTMQFGVGCGSSENSAPADVRAVFAKAKAAVDEDEKLNLCGFYTGMSEADARTLVEYYGLNRGDWSIRGDPIYEITFSLKGVRLVTKGGNTIDELAQAVGGHVGRLKQDLISNGYRLNTIDGISITMSESGGFSMVDHLLERKDRENREAAERKAKLAWKGKSKTIPISDSVSIKFRSIPGELWFGQYEVTQAQWGAVMGENPSSSRNIGADNPVDMVSWDDCQTFLKKLNVLPTVRKSGLTFRLPTDEEWKFACRAGANGNYCWLADGTEITERTLDRVAWFNLNSDQIHPVGQKEPNAWGLYDMHGNVEEWTITKVKDKKFSGNYVSCGGDWVSSASSCHPLFQASYSPSIRNSGLGFRLCASEKTD